MVLFFYDCMCITKDTSKLNFQKKYQTKLDISAIKIIEETETCHGYTAEINQEKSHIIEAIKIKIDNNDTDDDDNRNDNNSVW